jgi:hypothetical protein
MFSKIISGAVLTGILLAASSPASFAATAPKDKVSCEKAGMKWDEAKSKCEKK